MFSINQPQAFSVDDVKTLVDFNMTNKILPPSPSLITFPELVQRLDALLSHQKNLETLDIDSAALEKLMTDYCSTESDWLKYALYEASYSYTRNFVADFGGNANLLVLVWGPGQLLAIHDHAKAHCCMKVLKGQLVETLYEMPDHEGPMEISKETVLGHDGVAYISDDIGLHRMSNPLKTDVAVSLHLYTPPYAAKYGCGVYECENGKVHHVDMKKYYSWEGKLV